MTSGIVNHAASEGVGGSAKKANLANLANLANFSGTRWGAIFAIVASIGRERPEPAAMGNAFIGDGNTLRLAGRVTGLLGNAVGGFLP
jgi:hypothetical protein